MGESKRKRSATAAFIEKYPDCYFCGGQRRAVTREHMPPKSLFDNSHRPDKLVMPACDACNRGTSTADLTASIVSRWNYYSTVQEDHDHSKLIAQVRRQAPDLIKEWTELAFADPDEKERARQHLRKYGMHVQHDAAVISIGPVTIRLLNLFSHKAVLALHFEHFKQPLPTTGRVCAYWKTKEDFANGGVPPRLLEILPEYGTLIQGKWNEHETFEYRYASNNEHGLFGCMAKLRRGLFVAGFTVTDASVIPPDDDVEWIIPNDPAVLTEEARLLQKL
jgi:hypothetical protein